MSIQMVAWVLDQNIKDPIGKLCLISIANAHNNTTGQCNPSYAVIASEASCERRTAIRKVKWLEEQGYIEVSENRKGIQNGANNYRINSVRGGDTQSLGGGDTVTLGGDTPDTRGGDTAVTYKEPEDGTRSNITPISPLKPIDVLKTILDDETAKAVMDHRKSLRKPFTAHAAKLMVDELKKTTDPVFAANEMILRGWVSIKSDWLEKDKPRHPNQDQIDSLLRIAAE